MPRNAAVLALSAVFLTGLVATVPGAAGGEAQTPPAPISTPSTPTPTPAPLKQVNGSGVVLSAVTPFGDLFDSDTATPASGYVLVDRPCEHLLPELVLILPAAGTVPALDVGYGTVGHERAGTAVTTMTRPAASLTPRSYCAAVVTANVTKDAPASGTLVLKAVAAARDAPTQDPVVSWVKYSVTRSTSPRTYALVFGFALLLGAAVGRWLWCTLRPPRPSSGAEDPMDGRFLPKIRLFPTIKALAETKVLPKTYDYKDPWASAVALLGAVGTPLLAKSGVLAAFSPQYATAGITVANIVVAVMLAVGPVLVAAFYARADEVAFTDDGPQRRRRLVLSTVGGMVLAALAAQLLLDVVYILTATSSFWVLAGSVVGALLVLGLLLYFVCATLKRDVPVSKERHVPAEPRPAL